VLFVVEDVSAIDSLAFEHTTRIMESVGEHVELGIAPGDKAAIVPDEAVAIVEGEQVTSHE
jgi:hypothetical protein